MIKYPHSLPPGLTFLGNDRVRKTALFSDKMSLEMIEALCLHFIRHPDPKVVPIYNFGKKFVRNVYYEYFYDMELMGMLSDGEKKAITLFDRSWGWTHVLPINSNNPDVKKAAQSYPKLAKFMGEVLQEGRYFDTHCGNIMIDLEEEYRLIDIEGFMLHHEIDHPKNAWITRKEKDVAVHGQERVST